MEQREMRELMRTYVIERDKKSVAEKKAKEASDLVKSHLNRYYSHTTFKHEFTRTEDDGVTYLYKATYYKKADKDVKEYDMEGIRKALAEHGVDLEQFATTKKVKQADYWSCDRKEVK